MDVDKITEITDLLKVLRDIALGPAGLAVFAASVAAFLGALYWRHESRQTAALEKLAVEIHEANEAAQFTKDEISGVHAANQGGGGRRR